MSRPATAPIEAVVFDFGGVLITPITEKIALLAERHDMSVGDLLEVLLGPRESGEHPWHRAERGELAVADIQGQLGPWAERGGCELRGDEIDELLAPTYRVVDEIVQLIARLRAAGLRTALLTNTFAEFRPTLDALLDLSSFDAVVESYAVGARKPEQAIYLATADALGVPHHGIAYLDDFDQNLTPAAALGWTTIHVVDPAAAVADVERLTGIAG